MNDHVGNGSFEYGDQNRVSNDNLSWMLPMQMEKEVHLETGVGAKYTSRWFGGSADAASTSRYGYY